jgi:hypothetical protein
LILDALLLRHILDVDLVTWEEHSKNFGHISYSIRVEILENILNIGARYRQKWDVQSHCIDHRIRYNTYISSFFIAFLDNLLNDTIYRNYK